MNALYQIFDVNEYSTFEEIKKSYYKLAKRYHPNSQEGINNPTKFVQIKEAYDKLIEIHSPKKSPEPKKPFSGERYYRILNPELDMRTKKYRDTIQIPENVLEMDTKIHCMWTNEFTITLEKGKKLPIIIEVKNKEIQLILNIITGF